MYPVPAVVTVAAEIAPELIVTEATPLEPSPRIGIAEIVEPEDVLKLANLSRHILSLVDPTRITVWPEFKEAEKKFVREKEITLANILEEEPGTELR